MGFERFWRGYDWLARGDLAVGWIFDWRKWLWGLVPSGGGMTFLWAAIENRSPLNVWIAAVVVMAALAIFVYFSIVILEKIRPPNILDPLFVGGHSTASSLMTSGKVDAILPALEGGMARFR